MVVHCRIPDDLTRTDIVPVPKRKRSSLTDSKNYRPIAIATASSKVLERVFMTKCSENLSSAPNQFGFKSGLGTDMAIYTLKTTISHYIQRSTPVYALLLDLSKAFDRVDRSLLCNKLQEKGVPPRIVEMLRLWYNSERKSVRWGSVRSSSFAVQAGVRQGSLMSPSLFNVYIDDLSRRLNEERIGCVMGSTLINHVSYADDMVLLSPSLAGLRQLLSICTKYAGEHGLQYNADKTEYIVFQPRGKKYNVPGICLGGIPVKQVSSVTYLGHIICNDLSDNSDIERQCRAVCVRANMLNRRFAKCSPEIRAYLFKTYCANFYTSPLWLQYTNNCFRRLIICYNNGFRLINNLPKYCSASSMFVNNRVNTCNAVVRMNVCNFRSRLYNSENPLVHSCFRTDSVFTKSWASAVGFV